MPDFGCGDWDNEDILPVRFLIDATHSSNPLCNKSDQSGSFPPRTGPGTKEIFFGWGDALTEEDVREKDLDSIPSSIRTGKCGQMESENRVLQIISSSLAGSRIGEVCDQSKARGWGRRAKMLFSKRTSARVNVHAGHPCCLNSFGPSM